MLSKKDVPVVIPTTPDYVFIIMLQPNLQTSPAPTDPSNQDREPDLSDSAPHQTVVKVGKNTVCLSRS